MGWEKGHPTISNTLCCVIPLAQHICWTGAESQINVGCPRNGSGPAYLCICLSWKNHQLKGPYDTSLLANIAKQYKKQVTGGLHLLFFLLLRSCQLAFVQSPHSYQITHDHGPLRCWRSVVHHPKVNLVYLGLGIEAIRMYMLW